MDAYIPIVVYRLPGDENWTAAAIGLEGGMAEGSTPSETKANLTAVLRLYIEMLTPDDPVQAAETEYLSRLTAPPEGVDWIRLPLSRSPAPEAVVAS